MKDSNLNKDLELWLQEFISTKLDSAYNRLMAHPSDYKTVYVVGKVIEDVPSGQVWEIHGIYDNEQHAVARCFDETYFVGPIGINEDLPVERETWAGAYFPNPIMLVSGC